MTPTIFNNGSGVSVLHAPIPASLIVGNTGYGKKLYFAAINNAWLLDTVLLLSMTKG